MKNEWRDISGYEGFYKVSAFGEIKSLKRRVERKDGRVNLYKERVLKPYINNTGYYCVILSKNSVPKAFLIHRLVAESFLNNSESKKFVNHIDGNKKNNDIRNLEWVTHIENITHAWKTGLYNPTKGEKISTAKLNEKKVKEIRDIYNKKEMSQKELAFKYGVSPGAISWVITKKSWEHVK